MNDRTRPMILVVDDTPENIDVLSGLLGDEYDVKVAKTVRWPSRSPGKCFPTWFYWIS